MRRAARPDMSRDSVNEEVEPRIVRLDTAVAPETALRRGWRVVRGLLWCEWYAHSKLLLLSLGLDLPQILAKLYVNTGLIRPWPVLKSGLLYGLMPAMPFAIFAFSFVISAVTHSRAMVLTAWFWSALVALAALQLGFWYE